MKEKTKYLLLFAETEICDCCVFTYDQITCLKRMIAKINEAIESESSD